MDLSREQQLVELVGRLRAEAEGLRTAMRSRATIEQAKGILIERLRCSPDAAFQRLTAMSQLSGIRLVQVAASLVGSATSDPIGRNDTQAVPSAGCEGTAELSTAPPPERIPIVRRPRRREALQAQYQLFTAAVDQTSDCEQLATALAEVTGELGTISRVLIYASEPDGALRILGGHGYDEQMRSDWARIPSQIDTPPTVTARTRRPVWVSDPRRLATRFPALTVAKDFASGALACLPLLIDDCLVGVLTLAWDVDQGFDRDSRDYLAALADVVAAQLDSFDLDDLCPTAALEQSGGAQSVLWLALEGLLTAAALLTPLYDEYGEPVDFRIDHCNGVAAEWAGRPIGELLGRTVLELYPDVLHGDLVAAARAVLEDGSGRTVDIVGAPPDRGPWVLPVRITRLWNGLLVAGDSRAEAPGLARAAVPPETSALSQTTAVSAATAVPEVSPPTPNLGAAAPMSG